MLVGTCECEQYKHLHSVDETIEVQKNKNFRVNIKNTGSWSFFVGSVSQSVSQSVSYQEL